jgi:hypothetical protein
MHMFVCSVDSPLFFIPFLRFFSLLQRVKRKLLGEEGRSSAHTKELAGLPRPANLGANRLEVWAPEGANNWEEELDGAATGHFIPTCPAGAGLDAAGMVEEHVGCGPFRVLPTYPIVPLPQLEREEHHRVVLLKFDGLASSCNQVAVVGSAVACVLDVDASEAGGIAVDDDSW